MHVQVLRDGGEAQLQAVERDGDDVRLSAREGGDAVAIHRHVRRNRGESLVELRGVDGLFGGTLSLHDEEHRGGADETDAVSDCIEALGIDGILSQATPRRPLRGLGQVAVGRRVITACGESGEDLPLGAVRDRSTEDAAGRCVRRVGDRGGRHVAVCASAGNTVGDGACRTSPREGTARHERRQREHACSSDGTNRDQGHATSAQR